MRTCRQAAEWWFCSSKKFVEDRTPNLGDFQGFLLCFFLSCVLIIEVSADRPMPSMTLYFKHACLGKEFHLFSLTEMLWN